MLIKVEGPKTNFVDRNDNFVGYDTGNICCCENPYWEFEDENGDSLGENVAPGIDLEFLGEMVDKRDYVSFPCTNGYSLNLVNIHNGYYAHFWECELNGEYRSGNI